jgi:molecular chaperone HscB
MNLAATATRNFYTNASASTVLQQIQPIIHGIQSDLYEPVKQIMEHYQKGIITKEKLLQIKDYCYNKKYLTRILAGIH